jgi:hypothetical protein
MIKNSEPDSEKRRRHCGAVEYEIQNSGKGSHANECGIFTSWRAKWSFFTTVLVFHFYVLVGFFRQNLQNLKNLRAVTCSEIVSFGARDFAAGEDLARWLLY